MELETRDAQAEAPPEVLPEAPHTEEATPTPAATPAEPEEAPSALDLLIGKIETRLTNLEAASHSGHSLDQSAIDQIATLVLARINVDQIASLVLARIDERISKHLG